jgi:hypothetical protein
MGMTTVDRRGGDVQTNHHSINQFFADSIGKEVLISDDT